MFTVAIDFDGSLVEDAPPLRWRPGARAVLAGMFGQGHHLILHSCRCNPEPQSPMEDSEVAGLDLKVEDDLERLVSRVQGEMVAAGLVLEPNFYLGDSDFWTANFGISINLPWFLANGALWELANKSAYRYTVDQALRCLRHEVGHAVVYAYELWRLPRWRDVFGDMTAPYRDDFQADADHAGDFVEYLNGVPGVPAHYAQKHPDDAWAEAFAYWLDPAPPSRDMTPVALDKLRAVEDLVVGVRGVEPLNRSLGRPTPYRRVKGTVGEVLGLSDRSERFEKMMAFLEHENALGFFDNVWRSRGKPIADIYIDDRAEQPDWPSIAAEFGLPLSHGR